jgi:hypothetical protein
MQIAEMRSALETDHAKRGMGAFPNMPAWAVRRVFEKRHGLSLTPLPREVEVRSLRSIMATARPAPESKNQEALGLRLMIARMFNGN